MTSNLSKLKTKCGPIWLSNLKFLDLPLTKLVMIGSSGDSIIIESTMLLSASSFIRNITEKFDASQELQVVFPDFSLDILRQLRKLLLEGKSDHISKNQAEELQKVWEALDMKTAVSLEHLETEIKIEIGLVNEAELNWSISPILAIGINSNRKDVNQSSDMFEEVDVSKIRSEVDLSDNNLIDREELLVTPEKQVHILTNLIILNQIYVYLSF